MNSIRLEILEGSYLEHFKQAKDFALILPIDNPRRIKIEKEMNDISSEIRKLKQYGNNIKNKKK